MFGYFWQLNQAPDIRLSVNADASAVTFNSPTLNRAAFTRVGAGPYTAPSGLDAALVRNGDGSFTLRVLSNDQVLTFSADGTLLVDDDRVGNNATVNWLDRRPSSIVGSAGSAPGNTVTFAYNGPNGQVSSMSQTDGATTITFSYEYDAVWRLWRITDPEGRQTTFTYNSANGVSQITGPAPVVAGSGPGTVGKRDYGWSRTLTDTEAGARTWCGWGVLAHNATKVTAVAAAERERQRSGPSGRGRQREVGAA